MSKVRYIHIRMPEVSLVSKVDSRGRVYRQENPVVNPKRLSRTGGATVRLESDEKNPFMVKVQIGWCKKSDFYCRKEGRAVADKAEVDVVPLKYLSAELSSIEDQAMCHLSGYLQRHDSIRDTLVHNWDHVPRYFLPA